MSRTREAVFMGIGILAGIALSGPAAQAATAALTASTTSQTFYLNGQKVEFWDFGWEPELQWSAWMRTTATSEMEVNNNGKEKGTR